MAENRKPAWLRHELKPPVRAYRFQSHLVFYDQLPDGGILVLRIRHGREDWLTDMGEG
ncbi:MAG: type II toxin-antitoxin system RelE/ParE family toxin [Novosphingobium sp.]